ncbi:MAG: hypothetical protein EOM22_00260 [Gammaproteobacteria bacterium]|nr:hypothetical protein [Gammaproteobacteria bacterium]
MTATDKANAYLALLPEPFANFEAQRIIRDLIAENDRQRELIVRAIDEAISRHRYAVNDGKASPAPTWVIVKGCFCHGSTVSADICRQYGVNPEHEIGVDE